MKTTSPQSRGFFRKQTGNVSIMVALFALIAVVLSACSAEDGATGTTDEDELRCSSAQAVKLASIAKKVDGKRSGGYCYRYVKAHLRGAGFPTAALEKGYGVSAYKFAVFAKEHPDELSKMGLKKVFVGMSELPKGAVIVWPRGMCGYNKTHGHIEVVVDDKSSRACSDFCGRIRKGCGQPDIFIPKSCSTVKADEADGADDDAAKAPADDEPGDDTNDDAKPPTGTDEPDEAAPAEAGSCYSPTLEDQVEAYGCVQSRKDRVWFQCKDGKWYRGVTGNKGPFQECTSTHPL
jgi:hypothetical protein